MSAKYDRIGKNYNLTRNSDPYLAQRFYELLNPKPKKKYLDIGCGTGNYTLALHHKGVDIEGMDKSALMLDKAKSRSNAINWILADVSDIPVADSTYAGAVACLTIHHWKDYEKAFNEIGRILDEHGTLVIFTSSPKQMEHYWLNHYFPNMMAASINQMPAIDYVYSLLKQSGFKIIDTIPYFVKKDLQDLFLYSGKMRPDIYLRKEVRNGISSFSTLAHQEEVSLGLKKNDQ